MKPHLNLEFSDQELEFSDQERLYAQLMTKTIFGQPSQVEVSNCEGNRDTLDVGAGYQITKLIDLEVRTSILGEQKTEVVMFAVSNAIQTYSHHSGYDCDIVEISRERTLHDALCSIAYSEVRQKMENASEGAITESYKDKNEEQAYEKRKQKKSPNNSLTP